MGGSAGFLSAAQEDALADQAAFHPGLLPAFEPDRAVMGRHAQKRHA
jgi:hypothetical protein